MERFAGGYLAVTMNTWLRRVAGAAFFWCALFGMAAPAAAHPHAWIDVSVELPFDQEGRVSGLRETWLFDQYYTAFVASELGAIQGGRADQAKLDALLRTNMSNLKAYDYFTVVRSGTDAVRLAPVTEMSTRLVEGRLEITFLLPFETPVEVGASDLFYSVYDPTYYIEMLHKEGPDPIVLRDAPEGCDYRITRASPSASAIALAAALDRNQKAQDGFGALFAEKVFVSCPAASR